jgi:hypothetical protein
MDSADLYLEVLESGDRLVAAIAQERKIRASSPGHASHARCRARLSTARHEVELAAESYAMALQSYRLAALSEWAPRETASQQQTAFAAKCGIPARAKRSRKTAACRNRRHASEAFPVPAGLSKIP